MIKEISYISIKEILSRLLRHPLLQDITLEQVVQYTLDFIGIFGMPKLYQDREEVVNIDNYRGKLPCDLISINQVKDCRSNLCLRSTTDNFMSHEDYNNTTGYRIPQEKTFKTQGHIIFTSFKEGEILVSYKSIPLDTDGFPLLIDNSLFMKALETYIKKEVFTVLFEMGKVSMAVLQNIQQQYAWLAGQLSSEFTTPSISEMESISNMFCQLIPRVTEFSKGFKNLGNREYIKIQ